MIIPDRRFPNETPDDTVCSAVQKSNYLSGVSYIHMFFHICNILCVFETSTIDVERVEDERKREKSTHFITFIRLLWKLIIEYFININQPCLELWISFYDRHINILVKV